jgi:uncharacterized protein YlxW (UPF0749 family)
MRAMKRILTCISAMQKSLVFLLGNSSANAARFFASSSDAIRLVQMQKRHKEKLQEAQKEKSRLEAESRELNAELGALDPVIDLDRRLKALEADYQDLLRLDDEIAAVTMAAAALDAQAGVVATTPWREGPLALAVPCPFADPRDA